MFEFSGMEKFRLYSTLNYVLKNIIATEKKGKPHSKGFLKVLGAFLKKDSKDFCMSLYLLQRILKWSLKRKYALDLLLKKLGH